MKLAIMQPYFFPYIGYFQLMNAVDQWVVFDDIQFIDKGWINRNRILHPDVTKEWQYITIPLRKRGQFDKICDIEINEDGKWKKQIIGKLSSYKKKAPFYNQTISFIEDCLDTDESNLSRFLVRTLQKTAEVLEIETKINVQSTMALALGEIENPGQWALRISERLNASQYINPYGGAEIFDEKDYEKANIELKFLKSKLEKYVQRRDGFVSGLSIIDVMMWNQIEDIKGMLENGFDIYGKGHLVNG